MDLQYVGRKVKIELHNGHVYDGFVHSSNRNTGKLSLEKVTYLENGERKKHVGLQHFFADEIVEIIAGEESLRSRNKEEAEERTGGRGVMKGKYTPAHLQRLVNLDPTSLVLKSQRSHDDEASPDNGSGGSDSEGDSSSNEEYTILVTTNNLFYDAIEFITTYHVIGLAMEGVSIGREGRLCWIQIAVPGHVFLFDMLKLGQDGFDAGLTAVLEHEDVLKVLHNCRMVSDMLHHQYNIDLVNVFDTQVANVFVYRLWHHNDWPRYVDGLGACLVQHLDLPLEEVNWAVVREKYRETDEEVWLERPARRHLIEAMVKNVKHLISLRQVLMEKMMEEYVAGVNIYLSHVRDASQGDARIYQKDPHLLPMAFQDIRQFMKGRNYYIQQKEATRDMNGFRENFTSMKNPNMTISKDSISHVGPAVQRKTGKTSLGKYADTVAEMMDERRVTPGERKNVEVASKPSFASLVSRPDIAARTDTAANRRTSLTTTEEDAAAQSIENSETVVCNGRIQSDLRKSERSDLDSLNNGTQGASSEGEELTGTSLMRALIQEQSPAGGEDHSDIDFYNIQPAGKLQSKNLRKTKTPSATNGVVIPDLSKYSCSSAAHYRKTFTDQEIKMISRFNRKNKQDDWDDDSDNHADSILAKPQTERVRHVDHTWQHLYESKQQLPSLESAKSALQFLRNPDNENVLYDNSKPITENTPSSNTHEADNQIEHKTSTSRLQNLLGLINNTKS